MVFTAKHIHFCCILIVLVSSNILNTSIFEKQIIEIYIHIYIYAITTRNRRILTKTKIKEYLLHKNCPFNLKD